MKFLKWYSALIVTFSIAALIIELPGIRQTIDIQSNLWGIALYIPIGIYLWINCIKKGVN